MKKWLLLLLALLTALALTCAQADDLYHDQLARITDEEDPIAYTISTTEYGVLAQDDETDFSPYVDILLGATLTDADMSELPDGEFYAMDFPDEGTRLDFFLGEKEKNYVRLVAADGGETLCRAELGANGDGLTVSDIVGWWADDLAEAEGLIVGGDEWEGDAYAGPAQHLAGEWADERATLTVEEYPEYCIVTVIGSNSATDGSMWLYSCVYDEETDSLVSQEDAGIRIDYAYDESGAYSEQVVYENGSAVFTLDSDGYLLWDDKTEQAGEGHRFEKTEAEGGEEMAEFILGGGSDLFSSNQPESDSPEWVKNLPAAQDENVTQLFVVAAIAMDKTTANISMHQRDENGNWVQILSTPGFVGKNGMCADADHAEGCAQTPIGVYRFNKAFGIAEDPGCAIPYIQVDDNTYWSGDPDRQYNQMVDIRDVPDLVMDDSEHIVDYEFQYQYCLNISFNEEGTPGRGSAIFLHCLGPAKPWTGGCVAIPENLMQLVMENVQEDCVVVIDTLDNMGGSL